MFLTSDELDTIEAIVEDKGKTEFINILTYRDHELMDRFDISQGQFIPNMTILEVSGVTKELETFGHLLDLLKPRDIKNKRLDDIFKTQIKQLKKSSLTLKRRECN
jgi:hypothetical protein